VTAISRDPTVGTSGRATDRAIAGLKELISSGEFTAGARLPTERELTRRFGVSRSSLREAVRALALVGVLEPRVGDGTYVTTLEPDLLLTGLGFVSDLARAESLIEMHRVRRILQPEATRMATQRLSDEDLRRLEGCLRRMETADGVPAFIEEDGAFHRIVVDACGNSTLASLVKSLSSGTARARMWQSVLERDAVDATVASHRAIYDALVARDADRAAAADVMHLGIAEEWLRRLAAQDQEEPPGSSDTSPTGLVLGRRKPVSRTPTAAKATATQSAERNPETNVSGEL
jgi:GntR family transcriptional repressor for pyruvate dehydrogenase complex